MAARALRIGTHSHISIHIAMLTNNILLGLIPGDGIGREVIPVSPDDRCLGSLLSES